jgi:hypothetical protein
MRFPADGLVFDRACLEDPRAGTYEPLKDAGRGPLGSHHRLGNTLRWGDPLALIPLVWPGCCCAVSCA